MQRPQLTMLLDRPDEHDVLGGILRHPLENVHGKAECKGGASAACDEHDLIKLHWVGERAIGPVYRGPQRRSWMGHRILVEVAGESVAGFDSELDRRTLMDSKRMRLKLADCGNPDEAVLSRLGPCWYLLHDNLGAPVGKRV